MIRRHLALALTACVAFSLCGSASAANAPTYKDATGKPQSAQGQVLVRPDGAFVDTATPLPVNVVSGGASGVAQGSTTSGQTGQLVQCAATASAPSYLDGKTYPCSLTLTGGLRVDGSGVTQPVSLTSLPAFAAIPAFKIDQTTPGTTNLVAAGQSGTWNIGTLTTLTGGGVAHDGVDSGNPVKFGCVYKSGQPAVSVGDRTDCWSDGYGSISFVLRSLNTSSAAYVGNPNADGSTIPWPSDRLGVWNTPYLFNGTGTAGTTQAERQRTVTNGTDSPGTGIAAAGMVAQCDDISPTNITENQFGNVRMSCGSRALLVRPFEGAANTWSANVSLSDGTSTALHASCGTGLKNYLTWWNWSSVATTTAVTVSILDGATAKFDDDVAAGAGHSPPYQLISPIPGSAATALNVQLSGSPTGPVKVRAGGYCAP